MAYTTGKRMQSVLLPSIIDDYVAQDDPVRVYDAFVDALDFKSLGISTNPKPGADEYYPPDLLKLILYGYSYGIRSSRKLERACHHNLSFQWLMGGLKPDYRTIARFRDKYKAQIKKVLKQTVRICMNLNLIEGNVLFTDGSRFRANASINNTWDTKKGRKYLKKLNKRIDQLVDDSKNIDDKEQKDPSLVKLKEKIKNKKQMVEKIQGILDQLESSDKKSINTTDEDSVRAKGRQGIHACHNIQSTVDEKHGLIVHAESVEQNNDLKLLKDQVEKSSENLGHKPEYSCADCGYHNVEDIGNIDKDITVVVPSRKQAQKENGLVPIDPFDKEHFSYDRQTDSYTCPAGQSLVYQFSDQQGDRRYRVKHPQTCRDCPHFNHCTKDKMGRKIQRLAKEDCQEHLEAIYQSPQGQEIYHKRKEKVELPFGHMKKNLGAGQFMLRGKPKVDAEISILSTCFNIARMITIIGIPALITKLNSG